MVANDSFKIGVEFNISIHQASKGDNGFKRKLITRKINEFCHQYFFIVVEFYV